MRFWPALTGASLALLTACLVILPADAATVYVDNQLGDDRNDGQAALPAGGAAGPVRTIARALRSAEKGDVISIANTGVPYREQVSLDSGRHSGYPDRPFRIVGHGAVLDGSAPTPNQLWEHVSGDVFRFAPRRGRTHQLFREGLPVARLAAPDGVDRLELEPLSWTLFEGRVYFRCEPDRIPSQYDLEHSALTVGLTLYNVRHVVIEDLVVQGYQLDGVNCHSNVFDCRLEGLICRGNGRSGVSVGGASRVTLAASLIGNNGEAQVRAEGYAALIIDDCNLLDNTAPPLDVDHSARVRVVAPPPPAAAAPPEA